MRRCTSTRSRVLLTVNNNITNYSKSSSSSSFSKSCCYYSISSKNQNSDIIESFFNSSPSWSFNDQFQKQKDNQIHNNHNKRISKEELNRIAKLSKLKITNSNNNDNEKRIREEELVNDLEDILCCLEMVKQVNTTNIQPLVSPLDVYIDESKSGSESVSCPLREDQVEIHQVLTVEQVLQNAPKSEGPYFVVPQKKLNS